MKQSAILFIIGSVVMGVSIGGAEIPYQINYQINLSDASGNPLTGEYEFVPAIYDAETEGDQLWTETHPAVSVVDGLFSILLGGVVPIELTFESLVWLGLTVGGEPLVPRQALISIGQAYQAKDVFDQDIHP